MPIRVRLDAYPIRQEITTRVSDNDGYGHLNGIRIGHGEPEGEAFSAFQHYVDGLRRRRPRGLPSLPRRPLPALCRTLP